MRTDISDLDDQSKRDLQTIVTMGLRDVSSAFDIVKKRNETLNNEIRLLEIEKMLNETRGEFLKELINMKHYKVHSKFIGECVEEYELTLISNDQRRNDEDKFIDDLLNSRIDNMSVGEDD